MTLDGFDRRAHPHLSTGDDQDPVHDTWHELQERSIAFLQSITLETLVERMRSQGPANNYSI